MKTYHGLRMEEGCEVVVRLDDGKEYPLSPRWDIRKHSPTGFEWGYGGSGPAQLALAILADHCGPLQAPPHCPMCDGEMLNGQCQVAQCGYQWNEEQWNHIQSGLVHYQFFKRDKVAHFGKEWTINSDDIDAWLAEQKREAA